MFSVSLIMRLPLFQIFQIFLPVITVTCGVVQKQAALYAYHMLEPTLFMKLRPRNNIIEPVVVLYESFLNRLLLHLLLHQRPERDKDKHAEVAKTENHSDNYYYSF